MTQLIERGYIYIAQPPLYKVKKGKQEQYVKDDEQLDKFLTQIALSDALLYVNQHAPALSAIALEKLALDLLNIRAVIRRLSRRYFPAILAEMVHLPLFKENHFNNTDQANDWFNDLLKQLNAKHKPEELYYRVEISQENGKFKGAYVSQVKHGVSTSSYFAEEFFLSTEYKSIGHLALELMGLIGPGAYIMRGEKKHDIAHFPQAVDWLLQEAKKGQTIQRYKGLGEMNPEQLWETTMNPEARCLLKVNIEDAIAADEIFTVLMGDAVDPRRAFIEKNALEVVHLDV